MKIKVYKGKNLQNRIGITRGELDQPIRPLRTNKEERCSFCGITARNETSMNDPAFYLLGINMKGKGMFHVKACSFCTQCRHMNTVGLGRGELIIADYASQNNIQSMFTLTKTAMSLYRHNTASLSQSTTDDPAGMATPENTAKLQKWIKVHRGCSDMLQAFKGLGAMEVTKLQPTATTVSEYQAVTDYLIAKNLKDYFKSVAVLSQKYRYIPRESPDNVALIEFFATNGIGWRFPIDDWDDIAAAHLQSLKKKVTGAKNV